jgi:dihydrofolate reductase
VGLPVVEPEVHVEVGRHAALDPVKESTERDAAVTALAASDADERIWVIGGAELFARTIDAADRLVVTELDLDVDGDTFAPERGPDWRAVAVDPPSGWHASSSGVPYRFVTYSRA